MDKSCAGLAALGTCAQEVTLVVNAVVVKVLRAVFNNIMVLRNAVECERLFVRQNRIGSQIYGSGKAVFGNGILMLLIIGNVGDVVIPGYAVALTRQALKRGKVGLEAANDVSLRPLLGEGGVTREVYVRAQNVGNITRCIEITV